MNYKKDWEEYKETIQGSEYMQRLSLKNDEKMFMRGFEMALEKVHSIQRFEVIDHTLTGEGRAYIQRGDLEVEMQLQDNNETMKVFIK